MFLHLCTRLIYLIVFQADLDYRTWNTTGQSENIRYLPSLDESTLKQRNNYKQTTNTSFFLIFGIVVTC